MSGSRGRPARAPSSPPRQHTGRNRNPEARAAVLLAAVTLLETEGPGRLTIERIASEAQVSKQTIYRWWPSRGAVLLEAMIERASQEVPPIDNGDLVLDLGVFLSATFAAAAEEPNARLLRLLMAEAQSDPGSAAGLQHFIGVRRDALRAIFERARGRGELARGADVDLLLDQAFGVLWYRILLARGRLTADAAQCLAAVLAEQARR